TVTVSAGGALVDDASVPAASSGVSQSLSPTKLDGVQNNDAASFCDASSAGLFGGVGTPGAANDACTVGPSGDRCMEGATERNVRVPGPGELVITEVYANPPGTDAERDWLELYSRAGASVDLNGLYLSSTTAAGSHRDWQITSATCVSV